MSAPIMVVGHLADNTVTHFLREARSANAQVVLADLPAIARGGSWRISVPDDGLSFVDSPEYRLLLSNMGGVYSRLISLEGRKSDSRSRARWRGLCSGLRAWLEQHSETVVNRPGGDRHNTTKPMHEALIAAYGFSVPPSVTSSDRHVLREFAESHPTICKPCSGVRCDAFMVDGADFDHYSAAQGPVHLQRYIAGSDFRIHVVGTEVFPLRIDHCGVDYRAASSGEKRYTEEEVNTELRQRLVDVTSRMNVLFAGWDFRRDRDGKFWALEVNYMPAYRMYDVRSGGRISQALLAMLMGKSESFPSTKRLSTSIGPEELPVPEAAEIRLCRQMSDLKCSPTHKLLQSNVNSAPFIAASRRPDTLDALADWR